MIKLILKTRGQVVEELNAVQKEVGDDTPLYTLSNIATGSLVVSDRPITKDALLGLVREEVDTTEEAIAWTENFWKLSGRI